MAKTTTYRYLLVWLLAAVHSAYAVASGTPAKYSSDAKRAELAKVFSAEVGVKEKGCGNCGPRVETYLKSSGNHRGQPWCGAFVNWCFRQVGLKGPSGAGAARNWFPSSKVIYTRGATRHTPKTGDCVGYYYANLGRIGHVGFVESWGEDWVVTVEGNTGGAGIERNGDGVYRMRRLRSQISFVSRWVPPG